MSGMEGLNIKNNIYKKNFSLKYDWKSDSTPIILLIKAMQKLPNRVWDGYFIVKQNIRINNNINSIDSYKDVEFRSYIEKSGELKSMSYARCDCKVVYQNEDIIQLKTTLIKKKYSNLEKEPADNKDMKFFRVVTRDEVEKFCELSGDNNYIHRVKKPVVQAMLILLLLEDYLAFEKIYMDNCQITYVKPVLADSRIFLYWKDCRNLLGVTNKEICFKLKFNQ